MVAFQRLIPFLILALHSLAFYSLPASADKITGSQTINAFDLGVSSGDPSSTGIRLMTWINPDYYATHDDHQVILEVFTDEALQHLLLKQLFTVTPANEYSVSADLENQLQPDTMYYYRFRTGHQSSRKGQTRTLPGPEDNREIILAMLSCQDYSTGYFNALSALARRANEVNAVFFNGDFIYEYAAYDSSHATIRRKLQLPSKSSSAMTAEDFSYLYRTYLKDSQLQEAMASFAFIVIPDDHEVADNLFWNRKKKHHAGLPGNRYKHFTPPEKNLLMLTARKAWVNYIPARVNVNHTTENPQEYVTLYRSFRLGKQADLIITDLRSYRDGEWVDDDSETKTMLGAEQRAWFMEQMDSSTANWRLWGNEVMFSRFEGLDIHIDGIPDYLLNSDQWNGFRHEREALKDLIERFKIDNLVVLTGDMHTALAGYIKPFDRPDASNNLGIELMTPSVTSPNIKEEMGSLGRFKPFMKIIDSFLENQNHHLQFFNSETHGYSLLKLSEKRLVWEVYSVPANKRFDNPEETLLTRFVYEDGQLKNQLFSDAPSHNEL